MNMRNWTDAQLAAQALELVELGHNRTPGQATLLGVIHRELERRHPSVSGVLDRWAGHPDPRGAFYGASYTQILVGAMPRG